MKLTFLTKKSIFLLYLFENDFFFSQINAHLCHSFILFVINNNCSIFAKLFSYNMNAEVPLKHSKKALTEVEQIKVSYLFNKVLITIANLISSSKS